MSDEFEFIGKHLPILSHACDEYFRKGRPIFGLVHALAFDFVDFDINRIQFIRFLNCSSLIAVALLLYRFLLHQSGSRYLSFFTILFFFSQPTIQAIASYSLQIISNCLPPMWLSLIAFYAHFYFLPTLKIRRWVANLFVFVLLMLAMQATQTYAYFAMVPLSFLALAGGKSRKNEIIDFVAVSLASFIASLIVFEFSLHVWHEQFHRQAYRLAESSISALHAAPLAVCVTALNPLTYWSAFKVCALPYPLHNVLLSADWQRGSAVTVMAAWFLLCGTALFLELRSCLNSNKGDVLFRWMLVVVCFAFGAVFIIADSPTAIVDHRSHMLLNLVGVIVFSSAYALHTIGMHWSMLNSTIGRTIGGLLVFLVASSAQTRVHRIVDCQKAQLDFIRTELAGHLPAQFKKVVVVVVPSDVTNGKWHETRAGRYEYILAAMGVPPKSKKIVFVNERPEDAAEDEVIVDWNKYVAARQSPLQKFLNETGE